MSGTRAPLRWGWFRLAPLGCEWLEAVVGCPGACAASEAIATTVGVAVPTADEVYADTSRCAVTGTGTNMAMAAEVVTMVTTMGTTTGEATQAVGFGLGDEGASSSRLKSSAIHPLNCE